MQWMPYRSFHYDDLMKAYVQYMVQYVTKIWNDTDHAVRVVVRIARRSTVVLLCCKSFQCKLCLEFICVGLTMFVWYVTVACAVSYVHCDRSTIW